MLGAGVIPLLPQPKSLRILDAAGLALTGEAPPLAITLEASAEESYRLEIDSQGARLSGGKRGLGWGRQTLAQLVDWARRGSGAIPAMVIEDAPRFVWRGAHLDVCRHFFPLETIKRFLDLMAYHKLNVFHWHLTEDQGWRLQIHAFPRLTEIGAWRVEPNGERQGGFYTQDEAREIVAYAEARGISVLPEIEIPGHSLAALAAYPNLSCKGQPQAVTNQWGIFDDVYCPGKEETFEFLRTVLTEVLEVFPSPYIHVGGDECPKTRWKECPRCQERIQAEGLADEEGLQSYVIRRVEEFLLQHDRKLIGWDEILEGGLAPQATVMSWRGVEGGIAAAKAGHEVIMTPTSHCYLDHKQIDSPDETVGRPNDLLPLKRCHAYDPIPPELSGDLARYVLGGQGNLWTEYIRDSEELDYAAWPRLCALAEALWSPPEGRSWEEFQPRLREHCRGLKARGVALCEKDLG